MRRHRLLRSWNLVDILFQLLYISFNVFYVIFRIILFDEIKNKMKILSIINMASLFFDLHLNFLIDFLNLAFFNYRRIHYFARIAFFAFIALHIFAVVDHNLIYFLRVFENLYLLIVNYKMIFVNISFIDWQSIFTFNFLIILSLHFICKFLYEFFLCNHQALIILIKYVFWYHLNFKSLVNQICSYISIEIFDFTFVIQLFVNFYRNDIF